MQVLRDGRWKEEDAFVLVPGDVISIKLGDIIPADARLLEGDPLKIDQASAIIKETIYSICYTTIAVLDSCTSKRNNGR